MALINDQITAQNFKDFYGQIRPYLNGSAHSGFTPVGTVISVMGKQAPLNYLVCDGTVYNIKDYPELAAYFAGQFDGASNFFGGDGETTFAVPDLRGEFLRGSGTNSHTNQGNGDDVGVHQDATAIRELVRQEWEIKFKNPDSIDGTESTVYGVGGGEPFNNNYYTSRPTNTSVLYCIAYKNIFVDEGCNYSIDEKVVGTWIDGKPLYQKTITGTTPSSSGDISITGFSEVDLIFIDKLFVTNSYGYTVNLSYGNEFSTNIKKDAIYMNVVSSFANKPFIATIQYTKTTD